jgi:hypothetical protein
MNAALQDFRIIWRTATAQEQGRTLRTMSMVAGAAGACIAILLGAGALAGKLDGIDVLRFLVGVVALWQLLVWAFVFVPGSIRMNSPVNATLLPRQRRRLMQMTAASWLLVTLGLAFAVGLWVALPVVALGTLGLALLGAGNRYASGLLVVGGNWAWLSRVLLPQAWEDVAAGSAAMLVLGVLTLPAAAWGLRWLYPAGGDAYFERRAAQLKRVSTFDHCGADKQPVPEGVAGRGNLSLYVVALRADLRRADPGAMLMHALGPTAHWTTWTGAIATMLLVGGAVRIALASTYDTAVRTLLDHTTGVGPALLMLVVVFSTSQYGQQLRRTRGEQALLRLTPLAGDAALLNRRLAARMLRQALTIWAVLTVAVLAVVFLIGGSQVALLRQLAMSSLAGQVAMMGLLGDYAGDGGWNLELALRAAALAAVQALAAVGLGELTGTTAWPWLVAVPLAVCVVMLRRDWRRMLAAAPAFPAGRVA